MVYQRARTAARGVRRRWANHLEPITFESLTAIAAAMGASVQLASLPDSKSGMIIKYAGSQPRIYISDTDEPERQLFTLAHELGHLWERREIAGDDEYSFLDNREDGVSNLHEFFANEFAGELLVPSETVTEDANENDLARRFGITRSAAKERIRRLGVHPA